jgi:hypothetical protein
MEKLVPVLLLLPAFVCAGSFSDAGSTGPGGAAASSEKNTSALERATSEFRTRTRELGLRPDSPAGTRVQTGPKMLWHGRLYENFRNDILDAVPHEIRQVGGDKGLLRRNQFGFNVGGPLIIPHLLRSHNSTFFSVSYEGVRERIARTFLRTIPTEAERAGDFSHTVDLSGNLLPIYDPATTTLNPSYDAAQPISAANQQYLRSQFPGNVIPADRLNATALSAMQYYPAPNSTVGPFFQNNYFIDSPETNIANGVIGKVDRAVTDKQRVTTELQLSNGFLGAAKYLPDIANPGAADREFQTRRARVQHIWTASPQVVNTASLEVTSNTTRTGQNETQPFPIYRFDPYLGLGREFPVSHNARNTFDWNEGLSVRRGKHAVQFTAQFTARQVNTLWPQYPSGQYYFDAGLTSIPGVVNTGFGFASFLLGLPASAEQSVITEPSYFRNSYVGLGASDKYELRKGLTLTLGLTLNRHAPRSEKYGHESTIDPRVIDPSNGRPGALVAAGTHGLDAGLGPVIWSADPHLGVAWNPLNDSKTVIRLDMARQHDQIPIYSSQWGTQGFNAHPTFISANSQLVPAIPLTPAFPALGYSLPDLSLSAADNSVADWIDLNGREPMEQWASLSVERELRWSLVASAGASHSNGRNELIWNGAVDLNAVNPIYLGYRDALNDEAFRASLRPYPQFTGLDVNSLYPGGRYQRDSAYVQVEKRASAGLELTVHYQISKQFDDYSGPYGIQDFFNRRNDWALSAYNEPQQLTLSYTYELPFGPNKPLFQFSDWRRRILEGWSVSGTAYLDDGTPLVLHPEFNNTGGVLSTLYVNTVPGVDPRVSNPGPALWFNPAAFDQPPDFTMGDASRTSAILHNPGSLNMDMSMIKRTPLGGDRAIEFTASAFDFLNHANWNEPDTTIGPASAPNLDAGHIIGSHGGRVIQLGLNLSF